MKKITPLCAALAALLLLFAGCRTRKPEEPLQASPAETRYATLLQMQDLDKGVTLCRIQNPWQPERVAIQYLLIPGDTLSDEELDDIERQYGAVQTLSTPLRQQTLTASCHAALYAELHALSYVGVLCDADYCLNAEVRARLDSGLIVEAGSSMAPNPELILAAGSQAIWVTPYDANSEAMITALLPQLPIIYCADYQETSPLARAEWIRFYGRLVNKAPEADSLFLAIEHQYLALSHSDSLDTIPNSSDSIPHSSFLTPHSPDSSLLIPNSSVDSIPNSSFLTPHSPHSSFLTPNSGSILAELPFGPTWYVPGGRSSASWLYQDAGFRYPWADDVHGGSLALSPEAVFDKAGTADVWIFKYYDPAADWTLQNLLDQNPLYAQFRAAQTGQVYGCNTARSDYFEVAPFHPELILSEFRHIRRQELDSLRYFRRLDR